MFAKESQLTNLLVSFNLSLVNRTSVEALDRPDDARQPKPPPHVPIRYLRIAAKLTIDDVIARISAETGHAYSRGAISAVENGHRGASSDLLQALELVYDLPPGAIDTAYTPRLRRTSLGLAG